MFNYLKEKTSRNPWFYIPSQYFAEGIPFVLVNQLSVAMYKSLDATNEFIGMTSFLYLPWSLKFLWSPAVDATSTKRQWVLTLHLILSLFFVFLGCGLGFPSFLTISLVLFTLIAFCSATHDIVIDGYYLHALNKKEQAFFSGIRNTFYRFAMIFAGGILITLAGRIKEMTGHVIQGWSAAFYIASFIFLVLFFYHRFILPYPVTDSPVHATKSRLPYKQIFREYFGQRQIGVILSFILLFRFGEGLLLKMVQPFFLDKTAAGGMNLGLEEVGIMYGTIGISALIIGGILGGWLIKKYGLKKMIWPFTLCMHLPNLLFVYLAVCHPLLEWNFSLNWAARLFDSGTWMVKTHPVLLGVVMTEQFGYGLGFTGFMVYLLYLARGEFKTSHYAISTGLMAVGIMVPGFLSGLIQAKLGYTWLFIISCITTIPGMVCIFFLPFDEDKLHQN
ncbi:MAG: MFS transporter [Candidatus Aureabacteria bacterium]|nr:MFS transporter [Candidatus Auribacterota bacterium]